MQFATNPLPGMNPWLESHWGDVHTMLIGYARDALQPTLPGELIARVEEYVTVAANDLDDESPRRVSPDVHVAVADFAVSDPEPAAAAVLARPIKQPVVVPRFSDPQTLRRIRIIDHSSGNRVVTAIEFLSPANKVSSEGRHQYRRKQKEFSEAGVNLVEIDLIRRGDWMMAAHQREVPHRLRDPYRICVTRASRLDQAEMYHASFPFPLPTVAIPLRDQDDDANLELQPLIDAVYANGRYGGSIDYTQPPCPPPLSDVEIRWLKEHFAKS